MRGDTGTAGRPVLGVRWARDEWLSILPSTAPVDPLAQASGAQNLETLSL